MKISVYVDGSGGSDGGYGFFVKETGESFYEKKPEITNNQAEYGGATLGIRAAAQIAGMVALHCRGDSMLVVCQATGRWQLREPRLQHFFDELRDVAFGSIQPVELFFDVPLCPGGVVLQSHDVHFDDIDPRSSNDCDGSPQGPHWEAAQSDRIRRRSCPSGSLKQFLAPAAHRGTSDLAQFVRAERASVFTCASLAAARVTRHSSLIRRDATRDPRRWPQTRGG